MAAELPTEVGAPRGARSGGELLVDPTGDVAGEGFGSAVVLFSGDGDEGVDSSAGAGDLVMGATAAAAVGVGSAQACLPVQGLNWGWRPNAARRWWRISLPPSRRCTPTAD